MVHEFKSILCSFCGFEIRVPVYCGNRFCPICSGPRLARVQKRLNLLIKQIPFVKGCDLKHLTLTIMNCPDLDSMVANLVSSFRKLRHRRLWKSYVLGGAFVIEVTGDVGNWHAHIHSIIQSSYIPWKALLAEWMTCSNGRGVFIQRIPKREIVRYLTKYLSKNGVAPDLANTTGQALTGYRLFQTFGKWHGISTKLARTPYPCPKCKSTSWIPLDILLLPDISYIRYITAGKNYG